MGPNGRTADPKQPMLSGITVIDLCGGHAGSVTTLLLAELGADVIKVEPPGGHRLRHAHPAAFATWNRSKRSVVLDLGAGRDLRMLHALLGEADVLVHELPPSKAATAGLAAGELAAAFPRLIVSAITGYAGYHPDAERDADDLLVQARMGLTDLQPGWREGPLMLRLPAPTWAAACLAAPAAVPILRCSRAPPTPPTSTGTAPSSPRPAFSPGRPRTSSSVRTGAATTTGSRSSTPASE
jgi:crotonobetainyl-CoA:carnitine CoA-transferase CaiB-like acyl-CoA transferase